MRFIRQTVQTFVRCQETQHIIYMANRSLKSKSSSCNAVAFITAHTGTHHSLLTPPQSECNRDKILGLEITNDVANKDPSPPVFSDQGKHKLFPYEELKWKENHCFIHLIFQCKFLVSL